ncbi:sex comb on midleg-like protein 1 isoform X1 [Castor canadensis]|uniref:Sex comb on midleg-like protein 1 n=3 Tax=Castor canadensis TaxID=51338 RepID=A0A8B7WDV2_CASCN|nr:sex comb on midleg-like protein 1 [Castor canadensis]
MSRTSSEIDVQGSIRSDTSYDEEEQKTVVDVLTHCQVIYDAIQNLDKKFDIIHRKVLKIKRLHTKYLWHYRKPLGFACKNSYLVSKKTKAQKAKKRERHSSFSCESYSSTLPVHRSENDNESNIMMTSFHSDDPQSVMQESLCREQESPVLRSSPSIPHCSGCSYQTYLRSDDGVPGSSTLACFASSEIPITSESSAVTSSPSLTQREPISEIKNDSMLSLCIPTGFAASSPLEAGPVPLKQEALEDASTWSVDDVILFLKRADPQMSGSLTNLMKQHEIDGKALLLLNTDMVMKYMGLKLGTALKLCHYIEKLKEEKCLKN